MLVSLAWLRQLCPFEAEPRAVAEALTARGLTVDALLVHGTDDVLDVDVPANRPDCLGHLGLARELAAAFGVPLAAPPTDRPRPTTAPAADAVRVEIRDPQLCSRYTAGVVLGVRIGPSPEAVRLRLEACGLRSINNAVDVSNLVMLETGNPIHFFDLDRVPSGIVVVRCATAGETLTTLDGVVRRLDPEMLVIADEHRPIALAGVMGGAESEITEVTRNVLVEAAAFLPRSVRQTARRLELKSDASHRFERGVDPRGLDRAQRLAARLLVEFCGGSPAPGLVDVGTEPQPARKLILHLASIERLLGYRPQAAQTRDALDALGLQPVPHTADALAVSVPSWRVDLEREEDLVEEVARHLGYDAIPTSLAGIPAGSFAAPEPVGEERARDLLASAGFHEALGYAMIGEGDDDGFVERDCPPALALSNPIAEPLARLRRSILPGLLRALDLNLRRGARDVRLFEIGHVFRDAGPGVSPTESARIGIVWRGSARPRHWSDAPAAVDLPALSGMVEHVLDGLRPGANLAPRAGGPDAFHPGLCASWHAEGATAAVAWGGALHPDLAARFGAFAWAAEIDLDLFEALPRRDERYRRLSRQTAVERDLSLLMPPDRRWEEVRETLLALASPAPARVVAIDRYEGPPLEPGESALTVRLILDADESPLTEDAIEGYRRAAVEALKRRLGIEIRG